MLWFNTKADSMWNECICILVPFIYILYKYVEINPSPENTLAIISLAWFKIGFGL